MPPKTIKTFNWRALQKYINTNAFNDLNDFLENLPRNTGKTMLIIAATVWIVAGLLGVYTTLQLQKLTELRSALQTAEALKPPVPEIKNVPVPSQAVIKFVDDTKSVYSDLDIKANGATISITGNSTSFFGQFREAIGHVQNGGAGWRVNLDKLCVGRECKPHPLTATLKINKVSVSESG